MILLPFIKTEERLSTFLFSADLDYVKTVMLSGKPLEIRDYSLHGLVNVSAGVAILLLLFWLLVSILVNVTERLINPSKREGGQMCAFFWMFFASIFSKAFLRKWEVHSSRVMVAFWWFFIVIMASAVSGTMKAAVLANKQIRIDSVDDILKNPNLKPMIRKNTGFHEFFRMSERTDIKSLWRQIQRNGGLTTMPQIMASAQEVAKSTSIYIAGSDDVAHFIDKNCKPSYENSFYIGHQVLSTSAVGLPISYQLDPHFVQRLNNRIGHFVGNLIMTEYFRVMERRSSKCKWELREDVGFHHMEAYSLEQASIIFKTFAIGLTVATIVLITEKVLHYDQSFQVELTTLSPRCQTVSVT